jgi:hypothetical protein
MRLITIPTRHCCEKARRDLERSGLPYTEGGTFKNSTISALAGTDGIRPPAVDEVPETMRKTVGEFRSSVPGSLILLPFEWDRPEGLRGA